MTLVISEENVGRRLDKFLFAYLNNAPHSFIYKMLRKKRIKLNDTRATGSELLQKGDELRFFLSEETIAGCRKTREFPAAPALCGIIFEDKNLLVVNKPAGIASQGGMRKPANQPARKSERLIKAVSANEDHLLARCLYYLQETGAVRGDSDFTPALCNRLDVNTSGLVVCGKNLRTLQRVNALFAARGEKGVKKEYLAIVHGNVGKTGEERILKNLFAKNHKTNKVTVLELPEETPETQKTLETQEIPETSNVPADVIITKYTVLATAEKHTLLNVSPITGRSHQIRAHLSYIGHPITGDKKYNSPAPLTYFLHCRRLQFPDGTAFEAPLPEKFTAFIREIFNINF